jgi:hypothetical protein
LKHVSEVRQLFVCVFEWWSTILPGDLPGENSAPPGKTIGNPELMLRRETEQK